MAACSGRSNRGLVSRTVEKAHKLANMFDIEHVGNDLERMVAEVKPDFIDICTTPDSHYHYTKLVSINVSLLPPMIYCGSSRLR